MFLLLLLSTSVVLSSPGAAHATVYAQIEGTGSTWSQLIVNQWIADVNANGMQVVYTGGGSSKGRTRLRQRQHRLRDLGDPLPGHRRAGATPTRSNGRAYAYLPIVAGGTSFTYQLKVGGQLVRNLRLSGETIAKIFTNQITNWNDPAITKDNNGRSSSRRCRSPRWSAPTAPARRPSSPRGWTTQYPVDLAAVLRPLRADVVLPDQAARAWSARPAPTR